MELFQLKHKLHGRPVIAYGKGGILDSVIPEKTGIFFENQTVGDLEAAIAKFESMKFNKQEIRNHAMKFDEKEFRRKMIEFITKVGENRS